MTPVADTALVAAVTGCRTGRSAASSSWSSFELDSPTRELAKIATNRSSIRSNPVVGIKTDKQNTPAGSHKLGFETQGTTSGGLKVARGKNPAPDDASPAWTRGPLRRSN